MLLRQDKIKVLKYLSVATLGFALTNVSNADAGELIRFISSRRAITNRVKSTPEITRPFQSVSFRGAEIPSKNIYEERVLQIQNEYAAYDRRLELWKYKVDQIKERKEKEAERKAEQLARQEKREKRLRDLNKTTIAKRLPDSSSAADIIQSSGRSKEVESGVIDQRKQSSQRPSLLQRLKRALFG